MTHSPRSPSGLATWRNWFGPADPSMLGLFRVLFCGVMYVEFGSYLYLVWRLKASDFFLTYYGFEWVPYPGEYLGYALNALGMVCTTLLLLGFRPRLAALVIAIVSSWMFLFDQCNYNNHYYLYSLIAWLMVAFPFSPFGAWATPRNQTLAQRLWAGGLPAWPVWLLKTLLVLVYVGGALAKLDPDWLAGFPMKLWLPGAGLTFHLPAIDRLYRTEGFALFIAWSGLVFDAVIGFMLLHKRLRYWALLPLAAFHLLNAYTWNIGTFPWAMLALTALFFPEAPRLAERFIQWVGRQLPQRLRKRVKLIGNAPSAPAVVALRKGPLVGSRPYRYRTTVFLVALLLLQLLVPFRQALYPDHVTFTGEGHYFAWRMMLVDAQQMVSLQWKAEPAGNWQTVKYAEHLHPEQVSQSKRDPSFWIRYAQWWAENAAQKPVHAMRLKLQRSVNGRPYQEVFPPDFNPLSAKVHWLWPADYYLPYHAEVPMRRWYYPPLEEQQRN